MKIYIDLLILLNIVLDFIILISISIILKRNVKLRRIILGSLFGGLTILMLFIKLTAFTSTIFKLIIGLLMVIITFGYKNLKYTLNNFYYLLVNSLILGGGLYLIKDYGYYNYYILIINFVIIMIIYLKQMQKFKDNYVHYAKVDIYFKDKSYKLNGYLDTGNKLYDQYKKRPIILVNKKINYSDEDIIYVPCRTINNSSLIKCFKPEKLVINRKEYVNYLVGISPNEFHIDGVDCILHSCLKGEL